jgi:hypothetical protein
VQSNPFFASNIAQQAAKKDTGFPLSLAGGEGGIRTHGDRKATMLFESTPIVHSGTSPVQLAIINYQLAIVNF